MPNGDLIVPMHRIDANDLQLELLPRPEAAVKRSAKKILSKAVRSRRRRKESRNLGEALAAAMQLAMHEQRSLLNEHEVSGNVEGEGEG